MSVPISKAGQGINVSTQDAFNLGWKLAVVLLKYSPASLLHTNSEEWSLVAQELINFNHDWDATLSRSHPHSAFCGNPRRPVHRARLVIGRHHRFGRIFWQLYA